MRNIYSDLPGTNVIPTRKQVLENRNNIGATVLRVIGNLKKIDPTNIPNNRYLRELRFSDLDLTELSMDIDDAFGICINDTESNPTVEGLIDAVKSKIEPKILSTAN